jgi:NarL family two-component system response regulator LiaR
MTNRIKVAIVEDETLLRESLSRLIGLDPSMEVVGSYPNGEAAARELPSLLPNVLLTDLDMPKMNGIELIQELRLKQLDVQIVVLSKFGDDARLFSALKAGANGYLLKDAGLAEIRGAILEASEGLGRLSPALVTRVLAEFNRVQKQVEDNQALFSELSRREVEVLELIGKGRRNKMIAEELSLSEKTVKAHVGSILRKLHLLDRTEAALLAQRHGLGGRD